MYESFAKSKPENSGPAKNASVGFEWLYHDVFGSKIQKIANQRTLSEMKKTSHLYWEDLYSFEKKNLSKSGFTLAKSRQPTDQKESFSQQLMENASSASTNEDYYGLVIDCLPSGYSTEVLFKYLRKNFNILCHSYSILEPYVTTEAAVWSSDNFLSATMRFNTVMDDLTVFASLSSKNYWLFTPVHSFWDAGHPLAGHRQFGLAEGLRDGKPYWVFYIRAIDKPYALADSAVQNLIFNGADTLWKTVMMSAAAMISRIRGAHTSDTIAFSRIVDWNIDVPKSLK